MRETNEDSQVEVAVNTLPDVIKLIETGYIIVLDTNVLLNVYRYSPQFSDFALNVLKTVKDSVLLPQTVLLEYNKHRMQAFATMKNRITNASENAMQVVENASKKLSGMCDQLDSLQIPEIDLLRNKVDEVITDLKTEVQDFFDERCGLGLTAHSWGNTDLLNSLVEEIVSNGQVMMPVTQEDIYFWCEEGQKRYREETPPGFMDAKNKDGVRKYSDLILWKEILRFAKSENKDVIFVTDDVKRDWWERKPDNERVFHQKLITEFNRTGHHLKGLTSTEFYSFVALGYQIVKPDAVDVALNMTDTDYCRDIADEVFDRIVDYLVYSNTDYIDESTASIGSEGIDELEIISHEFTNAERIDRDDDMVTYLFNFNVRATGTSYDYWGRDDETKEVILSDGVDHEFTGIITVQVERKADIFLDFEEPGEFESAEIVEGHLEEVGCYQHWDDEPKKPGELGFCPDCGEPMSMENDGVNGFCTKCAANH